MITIRKVENADEKTKITLEIMNALPEWFSPPEDIEKKAIDHREYPFYASFDGGMRPLLQGTRIQISDGQDAG